MKHAGAATLDALQPLLTQVRAISGLREKNRGVFYRRGRAALHFHEDPTGLFADVRAGQAAEFTRQRVDVPGGPEIVLALLRGDAG